jgi:uncharacterized RmlC-like cupin family protein
MTTPNQASSPSETDPFLPVVASDRVTTIAPHDRLVRACKSSDGIQREICIDDGNGFICFASTEPGTVSHWYDHGHYTTYVLPLQGESRVEGGPHGNEQTPLDKDGSIYVCPAHLVHREVNVGTTRSTALIVRVKRPAAGEASVAAEE